jgi:hypothetical protein
VIVIVAPRLQWFLPHLGTVLREEFVPYPCDGSLRQRTTLDVATASYVMRDELSLTEQGHVSCRVLCCSVALWIQELESVTRADTVHCAKQILLCLKCLSLNQHSTTSYAPLQEWGGFLAIVQRDGTQCETRAKVNRFPDGQSCQGETLRKVVYLGRRKCDA